MRSLNTVDYIIVGLYFLSMILIGIFLGKKNKGDQDFFKGGNKVPWLISSLSLFVSFCSAYMFVAASGQAYENGLSCLLLFTSGFYGYAVAVFFAGKWRRTRIMSPMEYIKMRFGEKTRFFFTLIQIPAFLLSLGSLLYILCIFISSALQITGQYNILGIPLNGLQLCMIITGAIIVAYTATGGIWAVVVTDTVQFVIIMVVSMIILPLSFIALGKGAGLVAGVQTFVTTPPTPDYFHLIKPSQTLSFTLAWFLLTVFTSPGEFAFMQRAYCVPDERAARKATALAAVLFLVAPIIWVGPIFVMRSVMPDMASLWPNLNNPNEASYVTTARMLLPNGMIGLTISAIFAATMSTVSTLYNLLSAIFTRDFYKPIFVPNATHRHLMWVGRIMTIVFGIFSVVIGLLLAGHKDAFTTAYTIYSHIAIAFAMPVVAGLLIRKLPWWTAIATLITCFTVTLSLEMFTPILYKKYELSFLGHINGNLFQYKIFCAIAAALIVFIVARLLYNEDNAENRKADKLFELLKTPINVDKKTKLFVPDINVYRIVGRSLAAFGLILSVLGVFRLVEDPRHINLIAGLFFILCFVIIEWFTSPNISPFKLVRQQLSEIELNAELEEENE